MKILFLTHYYAPEGNAPATRVDALTRRWSDRGHSVRVITGVPNVPDGKVYAGYRNRWWPQRERRNRVEVQRVWTFLAANRGTSLRIANYLSFLWSVWVLAPFQPRPDILIATSPQFFCGWAGVIQKWVFRILRPWSQHKIPLVLEIRDIWPESIQAVGALRGRTVLAALQWLEKTMYHQADWIVTVGEGYKRQLMERGVPESKIEVIPNGVDWDILAGATPEGAQAIRKQYELSSRFVCGYLGTIGMACGLEVVLKAAQRCQMDPALSSVQFLIVGDGAVRAWLQEQAVARGLTNVRFTGRVPKEQIPDWLQVCDACLVHLKAQPLFETVLPSKIFEAFGMAKPIILGVRGEAAKLVELAGGGLVIEPENDGELVEAVRWMMTHPEQAHQMGRNACAWVRSHYDRDHLSDQYLELLDRWRAGKERGTGDR
jgi:glycosyltransferase involved in cell wall biosynthesis